jgi:hypothetical protein
VVETRNITQREPLPKNSKQKKTLISKLGDALKDVSTSSDKVPVSQRIKESKLLKDREKQQKSIYRYPSILIPHNRHYFI